MQISSSKLFRIIFFLSVFLIFFGRANQLIFWDAPFRSVLWDESMMKPIVEGFFNTPWNTYVTSPTTDKSINLITKTIGCILLLCSLATGVYYFKPKGFLLSLFYLGSLLVAMIVFLEFKEKFFHTAQLIEGSIQVGAGILLALWCDRKLKRKSLILGLKAIIALTFLGHGLYALGVYNTPGKFIDMTIILLNINEDQASLFLQIIGIIDILVIPFLFIPKLIKPILIYTIVWGILTAFARMFYYLELSDFQLTSFYMVHDTLYRLAHGLIPLSLLILLHTQKLTYENN